MTISRSRFIELPIIAILLIFAFIDAWAGRRSYAASDTVTYMDMASGIASGDFSSAVSGHFSPLYPIILAAFIWPFQTDSLLEFSAVRVANFLIFGVALLVFYLFLKKFRSIYFRQFAPVSDFKPLLSPLQFTIIAYTLFAWGCFSLTLVSRVNPDICIVAITFGIARVLLTFTEGRVSPTRFVGFGILLGMGYLFKAIFFPMSLLLVAIAALEPSVRRVWPRLLLSLVTFFVIALPLVTALSQKYDHLTFGESGRLSYWWEILKENPGYIHWQGDPPTSGIPLHPTRKILESPAVYEFAHPIVATYPPWYDPTYWNAGAALRFDPQRQITGIVANLGKLVAALRGPFSVVALAVLLVVLIGWRHFRISLAPVWHFRSLWLFGAGNLAIYLMVLVETRYVAGCLPLLGILTLTTLQSRTPSFARPFAALVVTLSVLGMGLQFGPRLARAAVVIVQNSGDVRDENWLVAQEFQRLGISPGTPVAAIDQLDDTHWSAARISDWARLARVHVVGEVYNFPQSFWQISPEGQANALQALSRAGARLVVASGVPAEANTADWVQIQGSRYFYRFLQ